MHELVDIGANLTHDSFDSDRDAVIARAHAVGVTRLIVTGTDIQESCKALDLARSRPREIFSTAGVHPHHAADFSQDSLAALRALALESSVVAIGECGLDYFRDFSPRSAQRSAFAAQLELARDLRLPVFLHQREAHADFLALLRERMSAPIRGVAHCFTGSGEEAATYLELGLHIGVTGWVCDERRGDSLRAALPHIPLDRLLLETDAPYLLPRDLQPKPRSRRNEPANLRHILNRVGELLDCDPELIAAASARNATRLFGLDALSP